jgi:N-dimethylarginine dimethylaminohydrolase
MIRYPQASPRRYLMCPPEHFDVTYTINPWMDTAKAVDPGLALSQWERLRQCYLSLGHKVEIIDPLAGLPDMVFAANGATVAGDRVFGARFLHAERAAEGPAYLDWFRDSGYLNVREPVFVNEGEGDYLMAGGRLLAGMGFRTDQRSHAEAAEFFGLPVVSLVLVDPYFYHLDTALAVLSEDQIAYYPPAFAPKSRSVLRELFPDAIEATKADAEVLGVNAVSDGRHVVLPSAAVDLIAELTARGYEPIGMDLSEIAKAGGGVKCCTLELRDGNEIG